MLWLYGDLKVCCWDNVSYCQISNSDVLSPTPTTPIIIKSIINPYGLDDHLQVQKLDQERLHNLHGRQDLSPHPQKIDRPKIRYYEFLTRSGSK